MPWVEEVLVRYLLPGAVSLKALALPLGVQQAFGSEGAECTLCVMGGEVALLSLCSFLAEAVWWLRS